MAMAIDTTPRRPLPAPPTLAKGAHQSAAYLNFVHVADFLPTLFDGGSVAAKDRGEWEVALDYVQMVKDMRINFARFTKLSPDPHQYTLPQAFLRHEAIALREGYRSYDLLVPVYCAPLDQPHDPKRYSFIAVQVKSRKRLEDGNLDIDGVVPCVEPIYVWLEMRSGVAKEGTGFRLQTT